MLKRLKKKRKFSDSLRDSLSGLEVTTINEDNFKREILLGIIAVILCFLLKVSKIEVLIILLVISLVLIMELINTAIEATVDLCTKEYHPLAKKAKDIMAGAVLVMCFFAVIIGIIIFVPKIVLIIKGGF